MTDSPIFFAGHSLGGARALLGGWSRLKRGLRLDGLYAFAPARPGDNYIGELFAASPGVIFQALRNHRDPVPNLPVDLKLFRERYEQPVHLTEINEPGSDGTLFADHHIELYQSGAAKLQSIDASISIIEAAQACADLYVGEGRWDWLHNVDGEWWGMRIFPNGARLMVSRGSQTAHDWLDNFSALQINVMDARVSEGFWRGVGPIEAELDAQLGAP